MSAVSDERHFMWLAQMVCRVFAHRWDSRGDLLRQCQRCKLWRPR
jgi:hypothetical protein